jgi:Asp-tRNA(Asn)/Glu-tRNA(Gln) amidotransferase A subunit family amidase
MSVPGKAVFTRTAGHAMDDYACAGDIAREVRTRAVSPVKVVERSLVRINDLNPSLNAFAEIDAQRALVAARKIEQRLANGEDPGPLAGVPVSIKSCIDVAGMRCDAGSRLRQDYVAAADAPLVARLRAAGAVIMGVTNTPEFLMSYDTDNLLRGRTLNPWDAECSPGGSSGGEAAAIASGCVAAGIGSDGGGSIRVPAHFTGICGLKPTPGRIPGTGHYPPCVGPFAQLGVVGPMARTIADLEIMLSVLGGVDDGDPSSAPLAMNAKVAERDLRVGVVLDGTATAATESAVKAAAITLGDAGVEVEAFVFEGFSRAEELWFDIFCLAGSMLVGSAVVGRESELSPTLRDFLDFARGFPPLTADRLLNVLIERDVLRAQLLEKMRRFPILLTPASSGPAYRVGDGGWGRTHPANYIATMRYSQWFNLLGNPAVVVPVSRSPEGLPIGVQVVARHYKEEDALAIAAVIEQTFGWQAPPRLTSTSAKESG